MSKKSPPLSLRPAAPESHALKAMSKADRAAIEAVPLCGPRTVEYLELVGVVSFAELAKADAAQLRLAVNASLGRPHINAMGQRAFQNAIDAARAASGDRLG
jgi:hypothetical protein